MIGRENAEQDGDLESRVPVGYQVHHRHTLRSWWTTDKALIRWRLFHTSGSSWTYILMFFPQSKIYTWKKNPKIQHGKTDKKEFLSKPIMRASLPRWELATSFVNFDWRWSSVPCTDVIPPLCTRVYTIEEFPQHIVSWLNISTSN